MNTKTAFINVPKKQGSCTCTRNGAMLTAIRSNCLDWTVETDRPLVSIHVKQQLRDRLQLSVADMNDNPHASYADHESRGVFGGFTVLERRGYWRVEWNGTDETARRMACDSADNHSNFGTY